MQRRQLTIAARIRADDLVRLSGEPIYTRVVRVTGSPGRRSPTKASLLRLFRDGLDGYTTVRADAAVEVRRALEGSSTVQSG